MSRLGSQPPKAELEMRGETETQMLLRNLPEQDVPGDMEMS